MNAGIRAMTCNREPAQTLRRQARSLGMRTLLEDGVIKALRGIMPTFKFEAMDTGGGEVTGSVEAATEEEAQQKIRQMGYFVTRLTKVAAKKKTLIDKLLTTVIGPFRPLIGFFKKPMPRSAPVRQAQADASLETESTLKPATAEPNVDSSSEFELSLGESDSQLEPGGNAADEKDIFETDFEAPAFDESGSAQARGKEESIIDIIDSLEADPDLPRQSESSIDLASPMEIQDAAPVHKLVNMVMLLAIKDKASDIHFEPFEEEFKMRYRCDGVLYEMVPPPRHLAMEITDRIKVMANLDTAERRLPQYGRIDLLVGGNPVPMRVSVLPTMFGESVAIRVLDRTVVGLDLDRVGMDPALLAQYREIIHKPRPNGIVLVTGPTGAGKTTTLYSALNELNEITDKIITAEDPVEYEIDGIVRCYIHDLTSTNALQSILGQDPDIIAVGAIRDHETAQIAVQAAQSGRLVLSTLDANDAPSSITRLRGMGLEPSLITATVKAILAQRLVRKICENCRTQFQPSPEMLMEINLRPKDAEGKKFYYGPGCERCNNTGFRGRCGIFELVTMNDEIRDLISAGASTDQLRAQCWAQGMTTLREAGLKALYDGMTTIEEVVRETPA